MKKPNIIVRMGAAHWDATVFAGGQKTTFDLRAMDKINRRKFIFEVVKAFRVNGEQKRAA